ncbi:Gfo/Idh/MocA family protein [Pseudozobellia thermophila]|uniref:Predicted dehydrogenase n=1 Tax=Pseudozobellia thermophila TaxID=192903 RepID=A0A1M6D991_9FLAO|nr:Gfo/Idh/MocA family oxidoreductase [Pseudozobellia thermophila]SHI69807.1 Predicted dehydrogenase [Pseudozobellia thermophila]
MSTPIGIGIVGTGSIVNNYIKCISELEDARLEALYTKSENRVKTAEEQFGVPVYSDLDEFMAQDRINLVCICNESGRHGEAINAAARAGKHVLSEKPLEVTTQKIDEVIAACERGGIKLGCVLQNRCSADYLLLKNAVNQGRLGKLLMGNAHINWYRSKEYYAGSQWRGTLKYDGGAAFMNQGIHTIDLLIHLMGDVTSVFGKVQTRVHDIEGEDVGSALLNFSNGAIGNITAGTALYPGYPERLEVYGEKGSVLMEAGKIVKWNVPGTDAPDLEQDKGNGSGAADPTAIGHQNHKTVLADMIDAIRQDRSPMVGGKEARKAVAVINAVYDSSKKEMVVRL